MTRSILAFIAAAIGVGLVAAPGCKATGVGDPCTPEQEYDVTFNGFDEQEVSVESKSFQCQTRLCLVNNFRGRVSCPFGQNREGNAPAGVPADVPGADGCRVPGSNVPVTGDPSDARRGKTVPAQCADRRAQDAVYCSCRCANLDGRTDDGANYCTCPDGFTCRQLVTSIGAGDTGLTGAYCIKNNTEYDRNAACAASCDPALNNCQ